MSTSTTCQGCPEQFTAAQAAGFVQGYCRDCTEWRINILLGRIEVIRNAVLHRRHQLAGMNVDSEVINAVLGIIDDATPERNDQ